MTRKSQQSFIDEMIDLLVKKFGVNRVQAALDASCCASSTDASQPHFGLRERDVRSGPTVTSMLEQLRAGDGERHLLLTHFYTQLKSRDVLPESQDIRHFAQLIGLKEINGKSRKDMIPGLMRFLIERPIERLKSEIAAAANVSEHVRQRGFSVLTDKLLGGNQEARSEEVAASEE